MIEHPRPRRVQALVSPFGITYLHRKNPYMIAWWSAAFPGFGHLILNQYARGVLFTLAEVVVNSVARINETLMYSFSGQFLLAKETLEVRWAIGYMLLYMFTIWDSYLNARSINKLYELSLLENARFSPCSITSCEIQYLEKRNPYAAAVFSLFFPGMGQLYVHRVGLAFYAMLWWWVYITFSYAHVSLYHLLLGNLKEAKEVLHCHWLLFMPSVTGGSVYHAFVTTIEHNRLFRVEQRQYLTERYGASDIHILPR
jgi:TM2 domain-containing membrane protein YozV